MDDKVGLPWAARSLRGIARELNGDAVAEDPWEYAFYDVYERYFAPVRSDRLTIMEVGAGEGHSTKAFSRYFEQSRIIAIDMVRREIDLSGYPNVSYHQANQTDGAALARILETEAPGGVDVIIDDASHIGWFSQIAFHHLFPHLKKRGLYVIKGWTTGYMPTWPDGGAYVARPVASTQAEPIPKRLPGHEYGMGGFIKWLVDIQGSPYIEPGGAVPAFGPKPLDFLHLYRDVVIARKATR